MGQKETKVNLIGSVDSQALGTDRICYARNEIE